MNELAQEVVEEKPAEVPAVEEAQAPELKQNGSYIDEMADSDIERLASEIGWKPNGGKRTAREWLKNSHDYVFNTKDTMEGLANEVKQLKSTMQDQVEKARAEERALNQNMIESLKAKIEEKNVLLDVAVEDGDKQAHRQHLKEQKKLEKELNQAEQKAKAPDSNQVEIQKMQQIANDYVQNNKWYSEDVFLRSEMDREVMAYRHMGQPFETSLKLAEKKLKRLYKDDFAPYEPKKSEPPAGNQLEAKESKTSKGGSRDGLSNQGKATFSQNMEMFKQMSPQATEQEIKNFELSVLKILKEDSNNFKNGGR